MRTKTPKQIFEQWKRIAHNYERTAANKKRVHKATELTRRYWHIIYKVNGVPDHLRSNDTEKCNEIWNNAATPASIYTK